MIEQPQNIEAEKSLLGALVIDPVCYVETSKIVSADDFYLQKHAWIYQAIQEIKEIGWAIDIITLRDQLDRNGHLEPVGGMAYITNLFNIVPNAMHAVNYAEIVNNAATRRRMINAASKMAKLAYNTEIDVSEALRRVESAVLAVNRDPTARVTASELVDHLRERVKFWRDHPGELHGLATGLEPLDKALGGLESGLYIMAARTSMGKTAAALQIAANVAQEGFGVNFFVIEGSDEQAGLRLVTSRAGVTLDKIKRGQSESSELARVTEAIDEIGNWPLTIFTGAVTTGNIRAQVQREMMRENVALVVIDYLGLMTSTGNARTRNLELGNMARGLKLMADDLGIPILALHQLNRGVDNRQSKRPVLSDLRESGQIEEHADVVLMLYREGYYNSDAPDADVMEIWIRKNRLGGPAGRRCEMFWNAKRMRLDPLTRRELDF